MLNDLGHSPTGHRFRSVDHDGGVIVAVDLAAVELLQPAVIGHVRHGDAFGGIGIQHCEEDASESGRIDVLVEERYVRVVGFCDVVRAATGVFGIPFLPAAY